MANQILTTRYYKRKDSPEGVIGWAETGVIRVSRQRDPDVAAMLDPYRLKGSAGRIMVAEYQ